MSENTPTKGQEIYERVEALVVEGMQKSDAYNKVAEERGLKISSVRGAYYQYGKKIGVTGGERTAAVVDPIQAAIVALRLAVQQVDVEIEEADALAVAAVKRHSELVATADERRARIQAKLDVLSEGEEEDTPTPEAETPTTTLPGDGEGDGDAGTPSDAPPETPADEEPPKPTDAPARKRSGKK